MTLPLQTVLLLWRLWIITNSGWSQRTV